MSCGCDSTVRVWDARRRGGSAITVRYRRGAHPHAALLLSLTHRHLCYGCGTSCPLTPDSFPSPPPLGPYTFLATQHLSALPAHMHTNPYPLPSPSPAQVDEGHACDVNVISWNRLVNYLVVSGADDGSFRVWDLRSIRCAAHGQRGLECEMGSCGRHPRLAHTHTCLPCDAMSHSRLLHSSRLPSTRTRSMLHCGERGWGCGVVGLGPPACSTSASSGALAHLQPLPPPTTSLSPTLCPLSHYPPLALPPSRPSSTLTLPPYPPS
jgi:WD40 repeat protein